MKGPHRMSSEFNSLEDLVFSRSFRNWVLNRDSSEHAFWENWIQRNPDKAEIVKNAKAMIYALHLNTSVLPEDEIDEEARKALIRLKEAPRYIPLEGPERRGGRWLGVLRSHRFWILAVLAAAIGVTGFFYYRVHFSRDLLKVFRDTHKPVREQATDASREQTFRLPDGSLVRLGKNSQLYFPQEWARDLTRREVFLRGEAFFDIRRNPSAPFYVYTDQVITKGQGTSWAVHAFPMDVQTTVTDRKGEVSVYLSGNPPEHATGRNKTAGIVLGPNQEVVYDRKENKLLKTLAEEPEPLDEAADTVVVFNQTPIRQIFSQLHELYGIPIQFDEEALDSCLLTATTGRQSFYQRLDLICKAIGGAYEVTDGIVMVTAVGCR
jgi:transmembrane sensor